MPGFRPSPEVGKAIEQELARGDLGSPAADPHTEQAHRPAAGSDCEVIARFEQMLQAQSDEPLYVTDVCTGIGVSERTLRLDGQDQLGMSPQRTDGCGDALGATARPRRATAKTEDRNRQRTWLRGIRTVCGHLSKIVRGTTVTNPWSTSQLNADTSLRVIMRAA